MAKHLISLAVLLCTLLSAERILGRRLSDALLDQAATQEDNNELDNNIPAGEGGGAASTSGSAADATTVGAAVVKQVDWVRISLSPGETLRKPAGARFEMECEAVGSPAPTLQWMKAGKPLTENEAYETNLINDRETRGLAKVRARLVVHAPLLEGHEGVYTCVAESGRQVATANTHLYVTRTAGTTSMNFSQMLAENLLAGRAPPRIVLYDTIYMDNIGEDIVLPCTAIGTPYPAVIWLDPNEQVVDDPRVSVLPDGGLRIRSIRWNDMGPYTCIARNSHGQDNITTFLYPMLAEK